MSINQHSPKIFARLSEYVYIRSMSKCKLILVSLILICGKISAQKYYSDSLSNSLTNGSLDINQKNNTRVLLIESLCRSGEFDMADSLCKVSLSLLNSTTLSNSQKASSLYARCNFFTAKSNSDSSIAWAIKTIRFAEQNNLPRYAIVAYINLSQHYSKHSQKAMSDSLLDRALIQIENLDDSATDKKQFLADYNRGMAIGILMSNTNEQALIKCRNYFKKAIGLYDNQRNYRMVQSCNNNIAITYARKGTMDSAVTYFEYSLAAAKKGGYRGLQCTLLQNIGMCQDIQSNFRKAISVYYEALLLVPLDEYSLQANIYGNIIKAYTLLGTKDSAEVYVNRSVLLFPKLPAHEKAMLQHRIAKYHYVYKEYAESRVNISKILEYRKTAGTSPSKEVLLLDAFLLNAEGKQTKAKEQLETLLAELKDAEDYLLKDLHYVLSSIYEDRGNLKKSLAHFKQYSQLNDSVNSFKNIVAVNDAFTKYETEKKETQNKLLVVQNAEQSALATSAIFYKRAWATAAVGAFFVAILSGLWFNQKKNTALQSLALQKQKFSQQIEQQENKNLQAILDALESERERISKDLHDRIGAGISTAKLYFEGLKELMKNDNKQIEKNFKHVDKLLATSIDEVRKVSHNMTSGVLTDFGLKPALIDLKITIEKSGQMEFDLEINFEDRLDKNIEINLYRIIQELVSNSIKYAESNHISVIIEKDSKNLNVTFSDNGLGFDPLDTKLGMGHRNMESRLASLGGKVYNNSKRNQGANYSISIPV